MKKYNYRLNSTGRNTMEGYLYCDKLEINPNGIALFKDSRDNILMAIKDYVYIVDADILQ